MGWTHWAYKFWNDPTTADGDQGLFADDTDLSSVKQAKVRVLVRTYAQAVAGTPLVMRFRPGSGRFWFRFRPDRSVDRADADLREPAALPARLPGQSSGTAPTAGPAATCWSGRTRPGPSRCASCGADSQRIHRRGGNARTAYLR